MPHSYSSATFQDLADSLDHAIEWMQNVGVRINNTRLAQYRRAMRTLATHFREGTLSQLFPESNLDIQRQAARDYFSYFYEVGEIINIYEGLSNTTDSYFLSQLNKFACGPEFTSAETQQSVFSRNAAFELLIAAQLMR